MDYLVESYNTIVNDTLMEQMFFKENKRYRWSRFDELAHTVYFDDTYMRKYMYGLAITSFLWPNHVALHDFFLSTFPQGRKGTYLEIGPGHGYYFMQSARLGNFDRLLGVDISAASVAVSRVSDTLSAIVCRVRPPLPICAADECRASIGDACS